MSGAGVMCVVSRPRITKYKNNMKQKNTSTQKTSTLRFFCVYYFYYYFGGFQVKIKKNIQCEHNIIASQWKYCRPLPCRCGRRTDKFSLSICVKREFILFYTERSKGRCTTTTAITFFVSHSACLCSVVMNEIRLCERERFKMYTAAIRRLRRRRLLQSQ